MTRGGRGRSRCHHGSGTRHLAFEKVGRGCRRCAFCCSLNRCGLGRRLDGCSLGRLGGFADGFGRWFRSVLDRCGGLLSGFLVRRFLVGGTRGRQAQAGQTQAANHCEAKMSHLRPFSLWKSRRFLNVGCFSMTSRNDGKDVHRAPDSGPAAVSTGSATAGVLSTSEAGVFAKTSDEASSARLADTLSSRLESATASAGSSSGKGPVC